MEAIGCHVTDKGHIRGKPSERTQSKEKPSGGYWMLEENCLYLQAVTVEAPIGATAKG